MKVKFSQNANMVNAANQVTADYKAGETHDLSDDQAQRWIKRGKATAVDQEVIARPERSPDDVAAEKQIFQNARTAKPQPEPLEVTKAAPEQTSRPAVQPQPAAKSAKRK